MERQELAKYAVAALRKEIEDNLRHNYNNIFEEMSYGLEPGAEIEDVAKLLCFERWLNRGDEVITFNGTVNYDRFMCQSNESYLVKDEELKMIILHLQDIVFHSMEIGYELDVLNYSEQKYIRQVITAFEALIWRDKLDDNEVLEAIEKLKKDGRL